MSSNFAQQIIDKHWPGHSLNPLKLVIHNSHNDKKVESVSDLIKQRLDDWSVESPSEETMKKQEKIWDYLLDYYFRVEVEGWDELPERPTLLTGIHSGTWLTMDAWVLCASWWRRFGTTRTLHGTAHDMLFGMPGLGTYFKKVGVIPASKQSVSAAFDKGHDVVVWPGGELDAMRSWTKRDQVVLGHREGFIRQAIRSGVPITPVATTGGHDTVFVISEGRWLAKRLHLKKWLRSEICPVVLGAPFGLSLEVLPMHIPLPAKIRIKLLEPIELTNDLDKVNDAQYVHGIYDQVEQSIQAGVDALAAKRKFRVFG